MNLLAHTHLGDEALIQHNDEGPAYSYRLGTVPDTAHHNGIVYIDTYTLIEDPEGHLVPDTWVTDFPLGYNKGLATIDEVKQYLKGATDVQG